MCCVAVCFSCVVELETRPQLEEVDSAGRRRGSSQPALINKPSLYLALNVFGLNGILALITGLYIDHYFKT